MVNKQENRQLRDDFHMKLPEQLIVEQLPHILTEGVRFYQITIQDWYNLGQIQQLNSNILFAKLSIIYLQHFSMTYLIHLLSTNQN
jgi:hypothetical protein